MNYIPEKINKLSAYEPDMTPYPIRLDANESFITLSEELRREIAAAIIDTPFNRYPDPTAKALCARLANCYGVRTETVCAGNGSDELISVIIASMVSPGGKVMTLSPDFSMYGFYCDVLAIPHEGVAKDDLRIDVDAVLEQCATHKPKLLIFSNPCSPTGLGLSRENVRRIIAGAGCLVVLDEAYMDFWNQSLLSEVEQYENLIILRTLSKAAGLAGLRLGFAVANEQLIGAIRKAKSPYNVNAVSQAIGEIVLRDSHYIRSCAAEIIKSKQSLERELANLSGISPYPSRTNFILLKSPDAAEIYEKLKAAGILVRLIGKTDLRVTAGSKTENQKLVESLKMILSKL